MFVLIEALMLLILLYQSSVTLFLVHHTIFFNEIHTKSDNYSLRSLIWVELISITFVHFFPFPLGQPVRKTLEVGHRGAQKAYNQQDLNGLRDRDRDRDKDRSGNIDINGIMNPYNENKNEFDRNTDYENMGGRGVGGGRGGGRNDKDYGSEDSQSHYHQYPDQNSYSQAPYNNNNSNSDYGSDGSNGNGFGNSKSNHSVAQNLASQHNQHIGGEDPRPMQGLDQFDERKAKAKQMQVSLSGI